MFSHDKRGIQETTEERESRLRKRREAYKRQRQFETGEQRQQRLMRRREKRSNETPEQKESRLSSVRTKAQQQCASETPEQRETRVSSVRTKAQQQRASETPEQRETRVSSMRTKAQQQRASESPEQRETRLSSMRTTAQQQRANETAEQRETRLNARRVASSQENRLSGSDIGKFHSNMFDLVEKQSQCSICLELMYNNPSQCTRCHRDTNTVPCFSGENNMDPGVVPHQLQGLSQVEKMLISRILPIMSIYRLPHGQYAYGGHIINLPQDINTFVNSLPRSPSTLDVLIVRREGAAESHKDFKVRRSVVLTALQWLVENNIYYRDVTIDDATFVVLDAFFLKPIG